MDAPRTFSFGELKLAEHPHEQVGLSSDPDAGGDCKGYKGTRTLAFKEGGWRARVDDANTCSVLVAKASLFLPFPCFYNCFCCCFNWVGLDVGPLCGTRFCCTRANCVEIRMTRAGWLLLLNRVAFVVHTLFAILSFSLGHGKAMEVSIFRVKPDWTDRGRNGYQYSVAADFEIRIDVVTGLFFLISAVAHGVWALFGGLEGSNRYLWRNIDRCVCWWRWCEYSLSASLMIVAIGMISGLREQYAMLGVFGLSHITMLCGLFTELHSRPTPVGYDEDGRLVTDPHKFEGEPEWENWNWNCFVKKFSNYSFRMLPHFSGYFPYTFCWYIVLSNFYRQIWELPDDLQDRVPWFVPVAINGTVLTFSSFTLVQLRYQWTAPHRYWKTELWYILLSLTAKLYLVRTPALEP